MEIRFSPCRIRIGSEFLKSQSRPLGTACTRDIVKSTCTIFNNFYRAYKTNRPVRGNGNINPLAAFKSHRDRLASFQTDTAVTLGSSASRVRRSFEPRAVYIDASEDFLSRPQSNCVNNKSFIIFTRSPFELEQTQFIVRYFTHTHTHIDYFSYCLWTLLSSHF